jgi:hypothetical protein
MLMCAIIRSVWLWKLVIATGRGGAGGVGGTGVVVPSAGGAGGRGATRGCCGDVAQVLTQCSPDCAKTHCAKRAAISSFMFNYFIKTVRKLRASSISSSLTMCGRPV